MALVTSNKRKDVFKFTLNQAHYQNHFKRIIKIVCNRMEVGQYLGHHGKESVLGELKLLNSRIFHFFHVAMLLLAYLKIETLTYFSLSLCSSTSDAASSSRQDIA